ncbi:Timeless protein [Macleaya cordata]|uniref:Timeless protein n=1 Tax=Macleaya cordata TaxID=56857 RepID=A0A200R1E1_MACCD|nr:Timeless protein [Macleaya cordata]
MDLEGLSTICAGLGILEEDDNGNRTVYTKTEFCLENLKDLQRFLRRYDPQTRDVFKQVCKWNIVLKDLVPIIEHCQDDRDLVISAVKILVFLTMPIEPGSSNIPEQIEYLWGLKASITRNDTVAVIVSLLEGPLENLEREAFTEDDWKLVQLVLTLFRNILAVQDISLQQKASGTATQFLSLRDKFIELLFHENVTDLILVLTQHVGGSRGYLRQDNLLLLEIFHYIFMGQEPALITKASQKGSEVDEDVKASLNSLMSIMEEEKDKRRRTRLRNLDRHTQFSGTFTRLAMDGSKTLFKGNPGTASHDSLLKSHKVQRGPQKRIAWDSGTLSSSKENILEVLRDFINQFLSAGYNVLMQSIREDIEKEHHAIQNSDVVVFFQVAQFVTAFQHHTFLISKPKTVIDTSETVINKFADSTFQGDICGPIAATLNEAMFLLVIYKWRSAFEGLKETNDYKFLSVAGSLMKNMIRMLDLVLKLFPEDSKEPQTARILLYKIFYDQTDQGMTQFLVNLIKSFDTHKQPKSDLADLIEMIHVVVRLMENLQARGTLRVSRKSRRGKKKKIQGDKKVTVDEQLGGDQVNIDGDVGKSTCKPSVDSNGLLEEPLANPSSDGKEESTLVPDQVEELEVPLTDSGNTVDDSALKENKQFDHNPDDLECEMGDSSEDDPSAATDEVDFKISSLVATFANNSIIENLCWLLRFYKSNSTSTNHYILSMLRRICDDLELSPMLYQLSLLTTFYDILDEQKSSTRKEYANIVSFLTNLLRKMLRKMKSQPLLFVEVLFWKTRKECHYINSESLLNELGNLRKETKKWGTVSPGNEGEVGPSQGQGGIGRRSIADALGDDEFDVVISQEGSYQNEGHSVDKSLRVPKRKKRLVFDPEMETNIKNLYEKHKDERHCTRLIAEALDPDGKVSPVQVSNKLKQLGLKVASKKRMLRVDSFPKGDDGQIRASESDSALHSLADLEESSLLKRSFRSRKRIRAFSKEQELMVKDLYEQFKHHKRCSHMIATALDADNTFTAAQISRKIKQLGLIKEKRPSAAKLHLRDEDADDIIVDEGAEESDEETLLALKRRYGACSRDENIL